MKLRPQTYDIVSKSMIRVVRRLQVPPGRYQLRIGAREATAATVGTSSTTLDAPDFSKGAAHDERHRARLGVGAAAFRPPTPTRR